MSICWKCDKCGNIVEDSDDIKQVYVVVKEVHGGDYSAAFLPDQTYALCKSCLEAAGIKLSRYGPPCTVDPPSVVERLIAALEEIAREVAADEAQNVLDSQ